MKAFGGHFANLLKGSNANLEMLQNLPGVKLCRHAGELEFAVQGFV